MKIFADASALVAIIAKEKEAIHFAEIMAEAEVLWSPISRWETVAALCYSHGFTPANARRNVEDFGLAFGLSLVTIGEHEGQVALEAYSRYGRNRHPAKLNMGDCFAYACAKTNDAKLLYKGDDFTKTDMA